MSDQSSRPEPVDAGEIMFVEKYRGMLNTDSGMALSFDPSECRGFEPRARNRVTIARIEGMQAFGLALISEQPDPPFQRPAVSTEALNTLLREARGQTAAERITLEALTKRLPSIDWEATFSDVERKEDGLEPAALVDALVHLQRPFERHEIEQVLAVEPTVTSLENPFLRIGDRWPNSWLSFLAWSNGGDFFTGERGFQDMLSIEEVREYTTLYGIAHFLPRAIPFAMDGGGGVYMFDTREDPEAGEYPIVFCHSSEVGAGWSAATRLEDSFVECCSSTISPDDV